MKFDCGPSKEEKRHIRHEKIAERCNEITKWHRWFAWHPVRVDDRDCRWLEYVERKTEMQRVWVNYSWSFLSECQTVNHPKWEYKAIND